MIVFKGELSEKSKNVLIKKNHNVVRSFYLFLAAVGILIGIATVVKANNWLIGLSVSGSIVVLSLLLFVFPNVVLHKNDMCSSFPKQITIDESNVMLDGIGENVYRKHSITDVKKVIETEDFYYLMFFSPFELNFICQKDLLIEGTIEEFELLFDGLIIKKLNRR